MKASIFLRKSGALFVVGVKLTDIISPLLSWIISKILFPTRLSRFEENDA
jgi:hypothetical protein